MVTFLSLWAILIWNELMGLLLRFWVTATILQLSLAPSLQAAWAAGAETTQFLEVPRCPRLLWSATGSFTHLPWPQMQTEHMHSWVKWFKAAASPLAQENEPVCERLPCWEHGTQWLKAGSAEDRAGAGCGKVEGKQDNVADWEWLGRVYRLCHSNTADWGLVRLCNEYRTFNWWNKPTAGLLILSITAAPELPLMSHSKG